MLDMSELLDMIELLNMTELLDRVAILLTGAALVAAAVVLAATRQLACALPVLLEFLTAAGLTRLARELTWTSLLMAGGVIVLRRLILVSLGPGRSVHTADQPRAEQLRPR